MLKKPNIIIFNPDEMRADTLAHLGNKAAITPNLDLFAKRDAISFSNAFCQNTVCVPSRCSFFTGTYPHVQGHRTMSYLLHEEESSLLKELKDAGWYVWMNRRNDFLPTENLDSIYRHCDVFYTGGLTPPPTGPINKDFRKNESDSGFYSFYRGKLGLDQDGKNYTFDDEAVDEAIRLIKNKPDDKPLCIFLGLFYPHVPYQVEEPYFSAIDRKKLPKRIPAPMDMEKHPLAMRILYKNMNLEGLSQEQWDELRSCYLGMCMKVDEQFGKICDALKEEGIYDDTDIYFFSDHGDYAGDYGLVEKAQNLMPDCLTKVPLLIKPHKGIEVDPGVTDTLTELVDFYATAVDFAGIESDHTHFGNSLRSVISDRNKINREAVFAEGGRTKKEKLQCTEAVTEPPKTNQYWPRFKAQEDDISHGKATMIRTDRYKFIQRLYEKDEFYDLSNDPQELFNEIDNQDYSSAILELKLKMLEWYQETCDIVPLKQDDRMSPALILKSAKDILGRDQYLKFEEELMKADDFLVIIEVCEKYGVRLI